MRVRIQFGGSNRRPRPKSMRLATGIAVLLSPMALMAAVLGFWKIGADLGVAGDFAIPEGAFSHWQVWLALAGVLEILAAMLEKYGSGRRQVETG